MKSVNTSMHPERQQRQQQRCEVCYELGHSPRARECKGRRLPCGNCGRYAHDTTGCNVPETLEISLAPHLSREEETNREKKMPYVEARVGSQETIVRFDTLCLRQDGMIGLRQAQNLMNNQGVKWDKQKVRPCRVANGDTIMTQGVLTCRLAFYDETRRTWTQYEVTLNVLQGMREIILGWDFMDRHNVAVSRDKILFLRENFEVALQSQEEINRSDRGAQVAAVMLAQSNQRQAVERVEQGYGAAPGSFLTFSPTYSR